MRDRFNDVGRAVAVLCLVAMCWAGCAGGGAAPVTTEGTVGALWVQYETPMRVSVGVREAIRKLATAERAAGRIETADWQKIEAVGNAAGVALDEALAEIARKQAGDPGQEWAERVAAAIRLMAELESLGRTLGFWNGG